MKSSKFGMAHAALVDPMHAHILSVRSSLQDTISVPLALNVTPHTVELCPSPGPAPKGAVPQQRPNCDAGNADCAYRHDSSCGARAVTLLCSTLVLRPAVHKSGLWTGAPDRFCAHSHSSPESTHSLMLSS